MTDQPVMCRHCGDPIPDELLIPPYHRRRYCSEECRTAARRGYFKTPCIVCGEPNDFRHPRCMRCRRDTGGQADRRREVVRLWNEGVLTSDQIAERVGYARGSSVGMTVRRAREYGEHVESRGRGWRPPR